MVCLLCLCEYTLLLTMPAALLLLCAISLDGVGILLLVGGCYALGITIVVYAVGSLVLHAEYCSLHLAILPH